MNRKDIHIRDPFILVQDGKYYLYGTRGATAWGKADGFDVFVSTDLERFEGPFVCFKNDGTFWADKHYWAPEVHAYKGAFYMFASFLGQGMCRGTAILKADSPLGPFRPFSDKCVTPPDWECLDGTFYVDKEGKPWIVFCHEWTQVINGEIHAMPLTDDLHAAAGAPRLLWKATDAPWVVSETNSTTTGYVTDGPFLYRAKNGELFCLWASFSAKGYTQGLAKSDNGEITGHFVQLPPIDMADAGHGMLFHTLQGELMLTLHSPNVHPSERPHLIPMMEADGMLRCK